MCNHPQLDKNVGIFVVLFQKRVDCNRLILLLAQDFAKGKQFFVKVNVVPWMYSQSTNNMSIITVYFVLSMQCHLTGSDLGSKPGHDMT